jgi:hypothetical protein
MSVRAFVVALGLLQACSMHTAAVEDDFEPLRLPSIDEDLPRRLSEFGVYPKAPDLSVTPKGIYEYEPRFPLWSNGSSKDRLVVPPDASEGMPAPDSDQFAQGTMFFKTFSFEGGERNEPRPIETRVMRLGGGGWEYYRYLWDASAADAFLLASRGSEYVSVRVGDDEFDHEVPSELDCKRCHEASEDPVLGFRAVQLESAPISAAPDAITEQVMGYVLGNCVHCHNGRPTDANSFDMQPEAFLENVINRRTEGNAGIAGIRVVPGQPEQSVLYRALVGDEEDEIQPMPPLGVQSRDTAGISLLREWIEGLER